MCAPVEYRWGCNILVQMPAVAGDELAAAQRREANLQTQLFSLHSQLAAVRDENERLEAQVAEGSSGGWLQWMCI